MQDKHKIRENAANRSDYGKERQEQRRRREEGTRRIILKSRGHATHCDDPAAGAPEVLFWIHDPHGLSGVESVLVALSRKENGYVYYVDGQGHEERVGAARWRETLKTNRTESFAPRTWEERALLEGVAEHSLTPASGVQQAIEMRGGERRYADLQADVQSAEAEVGA